MTPKELAMYLDGQRKAREAKQKKKLKEEAPTVNAGSGNVAGIGVGPKGEPGVDKKRKKRGVVLSWLRRATLPQKATPISKRKPTGLGENAWNQLGQKKPGGGMLPSNRKAPKHKGEPHREGDKVMVHSGELAGTPHRVTKSSKGHVRLVPLGGKMYSDSDSWTVKARHKDVTPIKEEWKVRKSAKGHAVYRNGEMKKEFTQRDHGANKGATKKAASKFVEYMKKYMEESSPASRAKYYGRSVSAYNKTKEAISKASGKGEFKGPLKKRLGHEIFKRVKGQLMAQRLGMSEQNINEVSKELARRARDKAMDKSIASHAAGDKKTSNKRLDQWGKFDDYKKSEKNKKWTDKKWAIGTGKGNINELSYEKLRDYNNAASSEYQKNMNRTSDLKKTREKYSDDKELSTSIGKSIDKADKKSSKRSKGIAMARKKMASKGARVVGLNELSYEKLKDYLRANNKQTPEIRRKALPRRGPIDLKGLLKAGKRDYYWKKAAAKVKAKDREDWKKKRENINEISNKIRDRYLKAANKSAVDNAETDYWLTRLGTNNDPILKDVRKDARKTLKKRQKGMYRAHMSRKLDESSVEKLLKYRKAAKKDNDERNDQILSRFYDTSISKNGKKMVNKHIQRQVDIEMADKKIKEKTGKYNPNIIDRLKARFNKK